jgi:hypothetical protein
LLVPPDVVIKYPIICKLKLKQTMSNFSPSSSHLEFYQPLLITIEKLIQKFDNISSDRKNILKQLTAFIEAKKNGKMKK